MSDSRIARLKYALHPRVAEHLTSEDDADLWAVATTTLLYEAGFEAGAANTSEEIYARIGCCHHWISPHRRIQWTAGGGFAWPFGYDKTTIGFSYRALPELCWSADLKWTGGDWEPGDPEDRSLLFRIAIPARTARRWKAAIHTIWTPHSPKSRDKLIQLYGFRKKEGEWSETAYLRIGGDDGDEGEDV